MRRTSTLLVICEIQINTTMKYYFALTSKAVTRTTTTKRKKKTIGEDVENLNSYIACWNIKWCSICGKQFGFQYKFQNIVQ